MALTRQQSRFPSLSPPGTTRTRQRFNVDMQPVKSVPKQFQPSDYGYEPRDTYSTNPSKRAANEAMEEERKQRLLRTHLKKTGQKLDAKWAGQPTDEALGYQFSKEDLQTAGYGPRTLDNP